MIRSEKTHIINHSLEASPPLALADSTDVDDSDSHITPEKDPVKDPVKNTQKNTDDEPAQRLLLVDDSDAFRERLARAFRERGLHVSTAANYTEAMNVASQESPDLAVIDLRMPGKSGLELLRDLKIIHPKVRVLVLTGFGSIATAVDAVRMGASNYLPKPADADDILAAFQRAEADVLESSVQPAAAPSLARTEWEHIHRVLADCEGNVSEAARRLGIHRRSLQRKLRKRAPD